MAKVMRRCCWPCMAIGLGLILFGAGALAQSRAPAAAVNGPGWVEWFSILLGALLALTGAYVRGLTGRLERLETENGQRVRELGALRERIAGEYHTKVELQGIIQSAVALAMSPLTSQVAAATSSMDAIHRRLDAMGAPRTVDGRSLFQRGEGD